MTPSFLSGVLVSWALAQIAVGLFFTLVYALGRREREYLLFGLVCFSLAAATVGIALGTFAKTPEAWVSASRLAHLGAIPSLAFNFHFAVRYASLDRARPFLIWAYLTCIVFVVAHTLGFWWEPNTVELWTANVFGNQFRYGSATPTWIATLFYVLCAAQLIAIQVVLFVAFRRGKREALIAWFGALVLCAAGAHDIFLVLGWVGHGIFMLPHAFMLYAFAVASTLVVRYRLTAGELVLAETNLKIAAAELRHSQTELREVQDELIMKEQLAAVGELAAAIAHEVRNPLAIIVNAVASLRRQGILQGDRDMLLGIVDEETGRLNRLVTDLLRFARPATAQRSNVALAELAERLRPAACADHTIEVAIWPGAPAQIEADAGLLRGALENLVENACQATPPGGRIRIVIASGQIDFDSAVRIEVHDPGSGMDAALAERARVPFFTTRPSGTGLGIPIVERIATAHNGRLLINSTPGVGTIATLLLPVRAREAGIPGSEPDSLLQPERRIS